MPPRTEYELTKLTKTGAELDEVISAIDFRFRRNADSLHAELANRGLFRLDVPCLVRISVDAAERPGIRGASRSP